MQLLTSKLNADSKSTQQSEKLDNLFDHKKWQVELNPKQIVEKLDEHIIGQDLAKKVIANALRNRYRRRQLPKEVAFEVMPSNILMAGPTGVGKTEIARRVAKLTNSPFIKVEATKFTEVGYVGHSVDTIIRDLVKAAINQVTLAKRKEVATLAETIASDRILEAIIGASASFETKEKFRQSLNLGKLDNREIEISLIDKSNTMINNPDFAGGQFEIVNLKDIFNKAFGDKKTKTVKMNVKDAYAKVLQEESDKLLVEEEIISQAIQNVEENGIVFIDEIDKIASKQGSLGTRGEVSREGVQRDLLPLVEGTIIDTKYGAVRTDHILFIGSGSFYSAKPSDLLPELQGRFPVRVSLNSLNEEDMQRILKEPKYNLLTLYSQLLQVENIELTFADSAIAKIANIAAYMNDKVENIGARRLHTILEKLLEEISFNAADMQDKKIVIDQQYVEQQLKEFEEKKDDMKFIL